MLHEAGEDRLAITRYVFRLRNSDYMATRRHTGKPNTDTVALFAYVLQALNCLFGISWVPEEVVRCVCAWVFTCFF